jgi:hypothetical protein
MSRTNGRYGEISGHVAEKKLAKVSCQDSDDNDGVVRSGCGELSRWFTIDLSTACGHLRARWRRFLDPALRTLRKENAAIDP